VIFGLGEMHLRYKLEKMASQYKLELATKPPQIPYRETVTKPAEGHCRHKKQSGGAGQFGEVYLKIEPLERGAGFEFVDHVKGGVIPGVFMPAVEKGVRQALEGGVVAGFPVEDLRVIVYDGKTHPVDGKEVAFVAAGKKATIAAIQAAGAVVLEPVVNIEVNVLEEHMGDVAGDLSSRRGHVTGTTPRGAAGRDQRLRLAAQVADRRARHLQHRVLPLRPGAAADATEAGRLLQARRGRGVSDREPNGRPLV
jgi:elongation factor G